MNAPASQHPFMPVLPSAFRAFWLLLFWGPAACTGGMRPTDDVVTPDAGTPDAGGDLRVWGPNDVSVLWPLPPNADELPAGVIRVIPDTPQNGPYFPTGEEIFPDLHADVPAAIPRSVLVVVALRVDPCAPGPGGSCVRQLRLSAQPISAALADAAIHLIYHLDETTFGLLLSDLALWRSHSPVATGTQLAVHPGLLAAGLDSDFARELAGVVGRYATQQALTRITFNTFAFDNWTFSKFDWESGAWVRTLLPGLPPGTLAQAWIREAQVDSLEDPSGRMNPWPTPHFGALLRADALAGGPGDPAVLAARDLILRQENPTLTHAENSDCVSCHVAGQARLWAETRGVNFMGANRYVPPAAADVRVETPALLNGNPSNTVLFGYHRVGVGHSDTVLLPSVSQRVAHETAQVVEALNHP